MKKLLILILLFASAKAQQKDTINNATITAGNITYNGVTIIVPTQPSKNFVTKPQLDSGLANKALQSSLLAKQDKLIQGQNIQIIGNVISASGGGSQMGSVISIKDFGASPSNPDNSIAIQNAITFALKNNIRTVFCPQGRYSFSKSLIEAIPNSFCQLNLIGESSYWGDGGTQFVYTGTQGFALGIQGGKGSKVKGIIFTGVFQPPFTNNDSLFFNCKFENFKDGVTRDSRNSPNAAIVIDPFTNMPGEIPNDGGYPELKNKYGLNPNLSTSAGSTGIEIEECIFNNFVVAICSSPNGFTKNAELTIINKVQFENCKLCISGGQEQEKENRITNIYCWGGTHTIFATELYGNTRGAGNWSIDYANIAGSVVRFIYNNQSAYFPTYISHVFAERLGVFGTFNSALAASVSNCIIDFAYPIEDKAGFQTLIISCGETEAYSNVVFSTCTFRYYGKGYDMKIQGNPVFDHCYFSGNIIRNPSCLF